MADGQFNPNNLVEGILARFLLDDNEFSVRIALQRIGISGGPDHWGASLGFFHKEILGLFPMVISNRIIGSCLVFLGLLKIIQIRGGEKRVDYRYCNRASARRLANALSRSLTPSSFETNLR